MLIRLGRVNRLVAHPEQVAQWVGLVQSYLALDVDLRMGLDRLMPQLEGTLSPDELQAALEHGKSLDLDTVVAELLAEFASSDEGNTEGKA